MTAINNAENGVDNALVNKINGLEATQIEMRTKPQPIGNGSLNYAILTSTVTVGPVTMPAITSYNYTLTLFSGEFNYNGLPAIPRLTLIEPRTTFYVSSRDTAHIFPWGTAWGATMPGITCSVWQDEVGSSSSETSGQQVFIVQIFNFSNTTQTVYFDFNIIIPRPALKPQ